MIDWKQSSRRKPLVLRGARQVGKTWLMKEFGNQCYEKTFYFSFDKEEDFKTIFASNKDPFRIVELLGIIRNDKILPEKHLIIFDEFLNAAEPFLYKYLEKTKPEEILKIQHDKLVEQYRNYLIVGGMPDCVYSWSTEKNAGIVLQIQKDLLELYENDISKYNGKVSAGLVIRIYDVAKPEHPLKAFEDFSSFKLFYFDVGLAKCAAGVSNEAIILNSDFQFKGQLTENYCVQQLRDTFDCLPHYYSPVQNYEVDMILQNGTQIIPVECKGGENVTSASFKRYRRENNPEVAIRFSTLPYKKQETMINVPLYMAGRIKESK